MKDFERQSGKAAEGLYSRWVQPFSEELQVGQRNSLLAHEIVPVLFDKCSAQMILHPTAQFYLRNRIKFHDSIQDHQREAIHVINALRTRYLGELDLWESRNYLQLMDPALSGPFPHLPQSRLLL